MLFSSWFGQTTAADWLMRKLACDPEWCQPSQSDYSSETASCVIPGSSISLLPGGATPWAAPCKASRSQENLRKDVLEKAAAPPHIKPVPPAQLPSQAPHAFLPDSIKPASPSASRVPPIAEAPRTDHLLVEDKPSPLLLPSLHPKHPQAVSKTVPLRSPGYSFADPTSSSF